MPEKEYLIYEDVICMVGCVENFFLVLFCLSYSCIITSKQKNRRSLVMAPLKYFQKGETAVLESAHNNGLKEVEENEVEKIVTENKWTTEEKVQSYGNYDKLRSRNCNVGY